MELKLILELCNFCVARLLPLALNLLIIHSLCLELDQLLLEVQVLLM